jgi:hypothetical protein
MTWVHDLAAREEKGEVEFNSSSLLTLCATSPLGLQEQRGARVGNPVVGIRRRFVNYKRLGGTGIGEFRPKARDEMLSMFQA